MAGTAPRGILRRERPADSTATPSRRRVRFGPAQTLYFKAPLPQNKAGQASIPRNVSSCALYYEDRQDDDGITTVAAGLDCRSLIPVSNRLRKEASTAPNLKVPKRSASDKPRPFTIRPAPAGSLAFSWLDMIPPHPCYLEQQEPVLTSQGQPSRLQVAIQQPHTAGSGIIATTVAVPAALCSTGRQPPAEKPKSFTARMHDFLSTAVSSGLAAIADWAGESGDSAASSIRSRGPRGSWFDIHLDAVQAGALVYGLRGWME